MMPLFTALAIPTLSGLSQPTMQALAVPQLQPLAQPEMKPSDMFHPHPVPWHTGPKRALQYMIARPLLTSTTVPMLQSVEIPRSPSWTAQYNPIIGSTRSNDPMIGSHRSSSGSASVGSVLDVMSR